MKPEKWYTTDSLKKTAASYGTSNLQRGAAGLLNLTLVAAAGWTCRHIRTALCPRESIYEHVFKIKTKGKFL